MHSWRSGERKSDHRKSAHVGPGQFILNVEKDRHYLQFLCVYIDQPMVWAQLHGLRQLFSSIPRAYEKTSALGRLFFSRENAGV